MYRLFDRFCIIYIKAYFLEKNLYLAHKCVFWETVADKTKTLHKGNWSPKLPYTAAGPYYEDDKVK